MPFFHSSNNQRGMIFLIGNMPKLYPPVLAQSYPAKLKKTKDHWLISLPFTFGESLLGV